MGRGDDQFLCLRFHLMDASSNTIPASERSRRKDREWPGLKGMKDIVVTAIMFVKG
jgi:hypothetical protein